MEFRAQATEQELMCHKLEGQHHELHLVLLTTWEVSSSGQPFCIKAHDAETNETADNCTDGTTGWVSRPDRSPDLQIGAVALTHDGNYSCELVTRDGNFRRESHLQVLVTPKATIFLRNSDSTVVCEAFAGKPAAQLSWSPEGDCVTKEEWHGNATVTVRSTYNYSDSNVSTVTCFVSHLTGNRNLSLDLRHDTQKSVAGTYIRYVVFPIIIILIIAGSFWFLKISGGFRKCKLKKRKTTPVVEEDEMQPYASYTEKNNPLYDTINQVDFPAATK
ncbi:cell surface glycoprotein CD200 receptor 1 [Ctenodactylus gundi]